MLDGARVVVRIAARERHRIVTIGRWHAPCLCTRRCPAGAGLERKRAAARGDIIDVEVHEVARHCAQRSRWVELFGLGAHLISVVACRAADELPSDAELVRAARGGDSPALGMLLDRHRASLHAHALGMLGGGEDAADAVQETFVLALLCLHQLRTADAAGAWLHAIVRSVCAMRVRRPWREIATAEIETLAERAEPVNVQTPLQDWVLTALEGLSEPLRVVTVLRYFGRGHSYAQIAQICGVPVGTVRSRLHQAKAELAAQLLAQAFDSPRAGSEWERRIVAAHAALDDGDPDPFVEMFSRDVALRGAMNLDGIDEIRRLCEHDLADGVRLRLLHIVTSAGITVVEKEFVNPPEDPEHCPPGLIEVLFHDGGDMVHRGRSYFEPRVLEHST